MKQILTTAQLFALVILAGALRMIDSGAATFGLIAAAALLAFFVLGARK